MTHSHGEYTYKPLNNEKSLAALYRLMKAQDLLWAAWPDIDFTTEHDFVARASVPAMYVLGGYVGGNLGGAMFVQPFGENTLVCELGLTGIRPYFDRAVPLFLGALNYVLDTFNPAPSAFVGRVAVCNRHILRLLAVCGFMELGRIPGLVWHCRKQKFMAGAMVMATPQSIKTAMEA